MSEICLIIPCYNEQDRLPVETLMEFVSGNREVSVLLVNDGSTDDTLGVIQSAVQQQSEQIMVLDLKHNSGKGQAVRQGILHAYETTPATWYGYWDADLATPLDEVSNMLKYVTDDIDMILCSRVKRLGAEIQRHAWRHCAGRVMATLISLLLHLPIYDTQCGAKLLRRDVILPLFSDPFISRWLFDVEILARMIQQSSSNEVCQKAIEVPVKTWRDIKGSKLKFQHMAGALLDLFRIYRHYHGLNR